MVARRNVSVWKLVAVCYVRKVCFMKSSILFHGIVAFAFAFAVVACGGASSTDSVPTGDGDTTQKPPDKPDPPSYGLSACVLGGGVCGEAMAMEFGTVGLGESVTLTLQVSNTGNTPATVDSVTFESDVYALNVLRLSAAGGQSPLEVPGTLEGGDSVLVEISIEPGQPSGALPEATVTVTASSGDGNSETYTATVNGTIGGCIDGKANCDFDDSNGCETNILVDSMNCGGCTVECSAVNGSSSCQAGSCLPDCDAGWEGDKCDANIDECTTGTDNCDANAACTDSDGSFSCACNAGYDGNGVTCTNIDECTAGTHDCDANAACTDNPGSFSCACNSGYSGDGKACALVDCPVSAGGAPACACSSGYTGTVAWDTDTQTYTGECTLADCPENADSAPACACKSGYAGTPAWDNDADAWTGECVNIDECAEGLSDCGENATCVDKPGIYSCICNEGYWGDGAICLDVDECKPTVNSNAKDAGSDCNNCVIGEDSWCVNNWDAGCDKCADGTGTFYCPANSCDAECIVAPAKNTCDDNAACSNSVGSYDCTCNAGFEGDGMTCTDIDECATGADGCAADATCNNLFGTFECVCNAGYEGTGFECADINECTPSLIPNYGTDSDCVECVQNQDSFCKVPLENDSYCVDCANGTGTFYCPADSCNAQCLATIATCDANATCSNSPGGYGCQCNTGYSGDGMTCSPI
jgi:hypothetical protein